MSDVLSPEEVDALLEGVSRGEIGNHRSNVDQQDAVPYDLTAADHISRSDIPSMDLLNQGLARYLRQSFKKYLKDGIEITVGDVVEEKFSDYVASLAEPTMLYLARIQIFNTLAVFVLSAELIQKYVDIYFGGGAAALERSPSDGFTSAEQRVAEQILEFTLEDFIKAWKPISPVQVDVIKRESSPQFCKFMESAEPIVVSKFNIKLDEENESALSCVLLSSMLTPLYEKMDASNRGSQPEHRLAWTAGLKDTLSNVELRLSSPIAKKKYALGQLVRLQAGDIIPIELDEKVTIKAGKTDLFLGKFGISRNKNSVRIDDVIQKNTEGGILP